MQQLLNKDILQEIEKILNRKDEETKKTIVQSINNNLDAFMDEVNSIISNIDSRYSFSAESGNKRNLTPKDIRAKIVEGRVNKLMAQRCLVEQPFVKNPDQTIEQLISGVFNIVKFDRFVLGEGLEKRSENFADEVMSQLSK